MKISFGSDNFSGVHPAILRAINDANNYSEAAYGNDSYTKEAENMFAKLFQKDVELFFTFNGTGANVLSLTALTKSYEAVISTDMAHINTDECGAPIKYGGFTIFPVTSINGKLDLDAVAPIMNNVDNPQRVQPKTVAITQATEIGTVYSLDEMKRIKEFAKRNKLYLHIDGARLGNAVAHTGVDVKNLTDGADVVSFGCTKNGGMFGEAVVFLNKDAAEDFRYIRKQGMQLCSKMRYIAAQYIEFLKDDLWLTVAKQANDAAGYFADRLAELDEVVVTQEVQANSVFVSMPDHAANVMLEKYSFYQWNKHWNRDASCLD